MSLRLNGSTSGYTEIDAPAVAGSNTLVLPTGAGSAYQVVRNGATAGSLEFTDKIVSGTAVASTSGTSIDFTGIPSWVKRVTVMFNGVSTNGTSNPIIRIGAGSVDATGYASGLALVSTNTSSAIGPATTGFPWSGTNGSNITYANATLILLGSNVWVYSLAGYIESSGAAYAISAGGSKTLSGTLDRVRITTVNGTDTFDAGSINILYE
jgi:hypothetical protein